MLNTCSAPKRLHHYCTHPPAQCAPRWRDTFTTSSPQHKVISSLGLKSHAAHHHHHQTNPFSLIGKQGQPSSRPRSWMSVAERPQVLAVQVRAQEKRWKLMRCASPSLPRRYFPPSPTKNECYKRTSLVTQHTRQGKAILTLDLPETTKERA